MKPNTSITINDGPCACTDGSIIPGCIIVQNYLTKHYLERATGILESHGLERLAHYREHKTDPDGDKDGIAITVHPDVIEKIKGALQELREVSDGVEAVDLIQKKEIEDKLKAEQDRFDKNVETLRRIWEG